MLRKKSNAVKRKGERPPQLSERAIRIVRNAVRKGEKKARMVMNETGVSNSFRAAQKNLAGSPFLQCRVLKLRRNE